MATIQKTQKFLLPQFEERPYGSRMKLDESRTLVVIAPHANTAAGIPNEKLRNGLRSHENEGAERIRIIGFADGTGEPSLKDQAKIIYRFEDHDGQIKEKNYNINEAFLSVRYDGAEGFWHVIENSSDRPILLMVTVWPLGHELVRG